MKHLALLAMLSTASVNASASEDCFTMARNYLIAVDQLQPEMVIENKRERFVEVCRMDKGFTQTLKQRVEKGDAAYAIHNNQPASYADRSTSRM